MNEFKMRRFKFLNALETLMTYGIFMAINGYDKEIYRIKHDTYRYGVSNEILLIVLDPYMLSVYESLYATYVCITNAKAIKI